MPRLYAVTLLRLFAVTFISGIFFGLNITNGQCSPDMTSGSTSTLPSSTNSPGGCRSFQTDPTSSSRYDNNQALNINAKRFIRAYSLKISALSCNANNVKIIQKQMQTIGGNCSTCSDGKFGIDTKAKLDNSCLPKCDSPGQLFISDTDPICPDGYKLENGCCKSDCSLNGKTSLATNGSCTAGYTGDNNGCCEPVKCTDPLKSLSGGNCSYMGSGAAIVNGCCKNVCDVLPVNGKCDDSKGFALTGILSVQCCQKMPNNCSGTQYGVFTGGAYSCRSCGTGTIANGDHTKCVCDSSQKCCGIELNTVVPFIGDCIELDSDLSSAGNTTRVNQLNAFPKLIGGLSKILVTAIFILSFVVIVAAGVMMIMGGVKEDNFKKGTELIWKVIIGLALLGASGIILRLINPNFFG